MKVFMVEVGVELEKSSKEFESYSTIIIDENCQKGYQSLYDENVIAFLDEKEAKDFIDDYVKKGVKNTYGFMWSIDRDVEDYEMKELKNNYFLEDTYYSQEKVLYFKGGISKWLT